MSWKDKFPEENRYFETENGILYCGDSSKLLVEIPKESVDLVLTDPPYNASNSNLEFKDKHYKTINEDWDKNFNIDSFFESCSSLLKPGGQMLIFCSHHLLGEYLKKKSLKLQQILHYVKKNPTPGFTKVYAFSVEYILWYVRTGKSYTFNKNFRYSYKDMFEINISGWQETSHPAEKNSRVIRSLILTHSNKNDLILDCFAGSGTILKEAEKFNRRWVGIEINPEYCEIIKKRIKNISTIDNKWF